MTRVEYGKLPPEHVRQQVAEWLRRHGIDPNRVMLPGWIELRPEARQIAYLSFVLDDKGVPTLDPETRHVAERVEVFQLEAKPLPLPAEFVEWAA